MTTTKIEKAKTAALAKTSAKYDAAARIRAILDEVSKGDQDTETEILDLVSEE